MSHARAVKNHTGHGLKPVSAVVGEAVQNLLDPAPTRLCTQLEHRAADASHGTSAAILGCAVEISRGIHDQTGHRYLPVEAVPKAMQYLLRPGSAFAWR